MKRLTKQERLIYDMRREGMSIHNIAKREGVAHQTVSHVFQAIREKGFLVPSLTRKGQPAARLAGECDPRERFIAEGLTPGGLRVSVGSDSQEEADRHLAALGATPTRRGSLEALANG